MIDGAGRFQCFSRVVLPLVKGGLAATAVLCFIFSWTEFLLSLQLTTSIRTLPVKISTFVTSTGTEWGFITALGSAALVPQYVLFHRIGWLNTYNPIVIPGFFAGGATFVFLLRQFMLGLPKELDEAAMIDGANHLTIWWRIIMPLCTPALGTIAMFLFVGSWNSFQTPLIYLQRTSLYTLPIAINNLYNPQQVSQPWPLIMAASMLATVPLLVGFLFAQRYVFESVAQTGLK